MHPAFYSLIGLAVGDAIGSVNEFKPQFDPNRNVQVDMVRGAKYNQIIGPPVVLEKGQWTDDTALALATAVSIIRTKTIDLNNILEHFAQWNAYPSLYSSNGLCFDIGGATNNGIESYTQSLREGKANPIVLHHETLGGNGALMRLAPIPMLLHKTPHMAIEFSGYSSLTTHNHAGSVDSCRYLAALIVGAIQGATKEQLLTPFFVPKKLSPDYWDIYPVNKDVRAIIEKVPYMTNTRETTPKNGFGALESLEAVLWHLKFSNSFNEGVLAISNLGDDSDTVAAIYGQVAGPLFQDIRSDWIDALSMSSFLQAVAVTLCFMSEHVVYMTINTTPNNFDTEKGQDEDRGTYQQPATFVVSVNLEILSPIEIFLTKYQNIAKAMAEVTEFQPTSSSGPIFELISNIAPVERSRFKYLDNFIGYRIINDTCGALTRLLNDKISEPSRQYQNLLPDQLHTYYWSEFVPFMFKKLLEAPPRDEHNYHRASIRKNTRDVSYDSSMKIVFKVKPASTNLSGQLYEILVRINPLFNQLRDATPESFCFDYMLHVVKVRLQDYIDVSWIHVPNREVSNPVLQEYFSLIHALINSDLQTLQPFTDVTHAFENEKGAEYVRENFLSAIPINDWIQWSDILARDIVFVPQHFQLLYTNLTFVQESQDCLATTAANVNLNMYHNASKVHVAGERGFPAYNKLYATTEAEKMWLLIHLQLQMLHLRKMRSCENLCGLSDIDSGPTGRE